jgi:AAA domain
MGNKKDKVSDDVVISGSSLLRRRFDPLHWVIPDVLVEGLTVMVGSPKIGKSLLSLAIAISVATGRRFFDRPIRRQKVLYLALEDGQRRVQDRLNMLRNGTPLDSLSIITFDCLPPSRAMATIEAKVRKFRPKLVVVDTLAQLGGEIVLGNNYASTYHSLLQLKNLADTNHLALIAMHHSSKNKKDDFVLSPIGSQGITAVADAVAELRRPRNQPKGTLSITGRDIKEMQIPLEMVEGVWQMSEEPEPEDEMSDSRAAALEILQEPKTPSELAKEMGITPNSARVLLHRMAKAGQVTRITGTGKYQAVEV